MRPAPVSCAVVSEPNATPTPETSPTLSRESVRRVARLARLALTDAQADLYAAQLSRVLEYVDQLRALDLVGVEPLLHPHDQCALPAPDEPAPGYDARVVRELAPRAEGPFIRVPKVLDADSGGGSA